jgi:hypothetical protein
MKSRNDVVDRAVIGSVAAHFLSVNPDFAGIH